MAQTDALNEIISFGVQNKKKKDEIMQAILKSGQFNVATAAASLKSLSDMGVFDYENKVESDPLAIDRSKLNVDQNTAYNYGTRMLESGKTINSLDKSIAEKNTLGSLRQKLDESLVGGTVTNSLVSPEFQKFDQAKRDFVNATLRKESGAVISPEEFDNATKQYFPVPGDKPEIVDMKRKNRELATKNLLSQSGVDISKLDVTGKQPEQTQPQNNQDELARQWLQENPNDPRAAQVKAKLDAKQQSQVTPTATEQPNVAVGSSVMPTAQASQQPDEQQKEKESAIMKIADFLGIKKFGQGLAGTAQYIEGEASNAISNATGGKVTIDKTYKELTDAMNKGEATPEQIDAFAEMTGAKISAKETIGSAAMTALNIITAGKGTESASLLAKIGKGALTGYGFDVANKMNEGKDMKDALTPGLATVIGGGLPVVGAGLKVGTSAIKNISSYLSGVPKEAIEEAFKSPEGVQSAIKTFVKNDDEKMRIVENARQGLADIMKKRGDAYKTALSEIEKTTDTTKLSTDGIKKKVMDVLGEFKLVGEDGKLDFTRSKFPKSQNNDLTEVMQRINSWKDVSPTGLNDLKQIIAGYQKNGTDTKAFDHIIGSLKDNVSSYLDKSVPAIGEMNKNYAKESALIEQMIGELGLGKKTNATTALNKLTSIFNNNSDFKEKLVKQLGENGGQQLIDDIVGSMFTQWFPRGLTGRIITGIGGAALGGAGVVTGGSTLPAAAAGAVAASPRVIGSIATNAGKVSKILKNPFAKALGRVTKTAIFDASSK